MRRGVAGHGESVRVVAEHGPAGKARMGCAGQGPAWLE